MGEKDGGGGGGGREHQPTVQILSRVSLLSTPRACLHLDTHCVSVKSLSPATRRVRKERKRETNTHTEEDLHTRQAIVK